MLNEIKAALLEARKSKNTIASNVLRVIVGEVELQQAKIPTVSDDQIIKIIKKMVASNEECLAHSSENNDHLLKENEILEGFLPSVWSKDQIKSSLSSVVDQIVAAKQGPAVGIAMKHLKSVGAVVESADVIQIVQGLRE